MADTASIPIIDVDSHVSEPADLWSSRLPRKWREDGPIVRRNPRDGEEEWWVGDTKLQAVGSTAMAGWRDYMPSRPPTMDHPSLAGTAEGVASSGDGCAADPGQRGASSGPDDEAPNR